jgi:hypothetical protein
MRKLVLFWLVAISPMFCAESQNITIKGSSTQGKNVLLIEARVAGKSVQLECFLSQKSCAALIPGGYSMERLTNGGIYQDCGNVVIYRAVAHATREKAIGEYCLLEP